MKVKLIQNILVIVICGIVTILFGNSDALPWWICLLPVMILGFGISLLKWELNTFILGFISGFLIWFGGNLLFDARYDGSILVKLATLLAVPKIVLLIGSGVIGGIITGLAMYVGRNLLGTAAPSNPEEMRHEGHEGHRQFTTRN